MRDYCYDHRFDSVKQRFFRPHPLIKSPTPQFLLSHKGRNNITATIGTIKYQYSSRFSL